MTIRIKNWAKFQHFKDRRPPWVKLYRDLLDDKEWHKLDGDSAKLLVMLWLLASENGGDCGPVDDIAFRLRVAEEGVYQAVSCLSHWLEQDDISVISAPRQVAPVADVSDHQETERETEEEREAETEAPSARPKRSAPFNAEAIDLPDWLSIELWGMWVRHRLQKKKPLSEDGARLSIKKLAEMREQGIDPRAAIEHAVASGNQGLFPPPRIAAPVSGKHAGFTTKDYHAGVNDDGTFS